MHATGGALLPVRGAREVGLQQARLGSQIEPWQRSARRCAYAIDAIGIGCVAGCASGAGATVFAVRSTVGDRGGALQDGEEQGGKKADRRRLILAARYDCEVRQLPAAAQAIRCLSPQHGSFQVRGLRSECGHLPAAAPLTQPLPSFLGA